MKAELNGKIFQSWKLAAREHGIGYDTFIGRVHNQGWDKARAATEPVKSARTYILNDLTVKTTDIAEAAGLSTNTVWRRIRRGMSPAEAAQPRMRRTFENDLIRKKAKNVHKMRRVQRHQDAIKNYKVMKQCHDCPGAFTAEQLEFDHCRGEKLFELSRAGGRSLVAIATEIAKCDVVCANCHRIRTHSRRKPCQLPPSPRPPSP